MKKHLQTFSSVSLFISIILLITSFFFSGCVTAKKAMYFPDMEEGETNIDTMVRESAKRVYPGDRVVITALTGDAESNQALNAFQNKSSGNQQQLEGYLVDRDGFVQIPIIGSIAVKGLTSTEIRNVVQFKLKELYKDVVVYCTISGRVVVLNSMNSNSGGGMSGGGNAVMSIPLIDERLTILEVLSTMRTSNLKLHNAWVIREFDGKRVTAKVNLNSKQVFTSPYYYLRNNDIVYIEPNKLNQFLEANAPSRNLLGIITGTTALFLSLIVLLK